MHLVLYILVCNSTMYLSSLLMILPRISLLVMIYPLHLYPMLYQMPTSLILLLLYLITFLLLHYPHILTHLHQLSNNHVILTPYPSVIIYSITLYSNNMGLDELENSINNYHSNMKIYISILTSNIYDYHLHLMTQYTYSLSQIKMYVIIVIVVIIVILFTYYNYYYYY